MSRTASPPSQDFEGLAAFFESPRGSLLFTIPRPTKVLYKLYHFN